MSIQFRLVLTITVLLCGALAAMVIAVIVEARPRIAAENASAVQMTRSLLQADLLNIDKAADPHMALNRAVVRLGNLRHVEVTLASGAPARDKDKIEHRSFWDFFLTDAPLLSEDVLVYANGTFIDTVRITPNESDELEEIWSVAFQIVLYGIALSLVLLPVTWVLIKRSLQPIEDLDHAIGLLEDGNYKVAVDEKGPPELRTICAHLNRLAERLQLARAENTSLAKQMILVQDEERREIARELHDDLGPHLFALRARASYLSRTLETETTNLTNAQIAANEITQEVDKLQKTNKRVLKRINPPGLLELGLKGALNGLATEWRKEVPETRLDVDLSGVSETLSESVALTVYRVAQEGLTNAYRHSGASAIELNVTDGADSVNVVVSDNGCGLHDTRPKGRGLRGMEERVTALEGTVKLEKGPTGGARLTADIPKA